MVPSREKRCTISEDEELQEVKDKNDASFLQYLVFTLVRRGIEQISLKYQNYEIDRHTLYLDKYKFLSRFSSLILSSLNEVSYPTFF